MATTAASMITSLFGNSERRSTQVITGCFMALPIIAIGLLLLELYSTVMYSPQYKAPAVSALQQSRPYQTNAIVNSNLFGIADGSQANYQDLPQTQLQLLLRGAFTATNPEMASAIIETADNETRAYKVGSRIEGNIKLQAVYADRVVLSRSGQLETLYFPEPETALVSAVTQPAVIDNTAAVSAPPAPAASSGRRQLTKEQRDQLIRQRLQELRDRARSRN